MSGAKHGLLLLGDAPDGDEGGAEGHDGHEDSGLHTAIEEFFKAGKAGDTEGACEAFREMVRLAKDEPSAPAGEEGGDEEEEP